MKLSLLSPGLSEVSFLLDDLNLSFSTFETGDNQVPPRREPEMSH